MNRTQKFLFRRGRAVVLLASLCLLAACEVDMTVAVDGEYPPTFRLSGSGYLAFFLVSEIAPENQQLFPGQRDSRKDKVLWEIRPAGGLSYEDLRIRNLPPITYGKVPPGFVQRRPEGGEPPRLAEGKVYEAGGPATEANGGFVWFTVRDGEVVSVPQPGGY